ncbi:carboxypeptidase M32 [Prochlorococcus sp. MIT 1307]|uniref:carboxypeptidase M32 n=1 Tax=Prochlorococcus sp. MIT 1307 TaxID=3096219 RepID=UPI002A760100|nr:carboxypeptidase M32 [Prochlorococcus sp. MIT 1307]
MVISVRDPALPALAWHRLGDYLHETQLLGSIQRTLYWDQNTTMPKDSASWRAEQLSLLARHLHARQSSKHYEELIAEAKLEFNQIRFSGDLNQTEIADRARNIELLEQDLIRQKRLDPDLVSLLATAQANGYNLWKQAKESSNFNCFAPALSNLIELRQEQARQLSEARSCWETLAQPFEPDLSISRLKELFDPLRYALPALLNDIKSWKRPRNPSWDLEPKSQKVLCNQLLKEWGRDSNITGVAMSPHPFSITLGPKDFRLTTRVVEGQPLSCFLATAHEWGHSLYEQGLPTQSHQWFAWPLGQATSMAVHESQSLFWENRVARSSSFAERFWPHFAKEGAPLKCGVDLWQAMNPLTPGCNRVEADELSYGLHILIRTDLEIALLEDGLEVEALPLEWNRRYQDLLGILPQNDTEGCLQDVHWSEGQFGYFPSYLLGHLVSAQLAESMNESLRDTGMTEDEPIDVCIRNADESKLLDWLRQEVHLHGRKMNTETLVEHVTGSSLSSSAFLKYLQNKLEKLNNSF